MWQMPYLLSSVSPQSSTAWQWLSSFTAFVFFTFFLTDSVSSERVDNVRLRLVTEDGCIALDNGDGCKEGSQFGRSWCHVLCLTHRHASRATSRISESALCAKIRKEWRDGYSESGYRYYARVLILNICRSESRTTSAPRGPSGSLALASWLGKTFCPS